jgi:oxaloacetate decarboxylase gamma subunit
MGARRVVNSILQGVELMLAGMGTVFAFLTLLVLSTLLMSRLVRRFAPDAVASADGADAHGPTEDEVVAIAAAVAHHRGRGP